MHPLLSARKIYILFVFLTLAALTCSQVEVKKVNKIVAVIFCDITTSVDSTDGIKSVANNAANLLLKFPPLSILYFRPIDKSPNVKPIFEFTIPAASNLKGEKDQRTQHIETQAQNLYNEILNRYNEINSDDKNARSCIIQTLDIANRLFKPYQESQNYSFELIYLSDMLEECDESVLGSLFMKENLCDHVFIKADSFQSDLDIGFVNLTIITAVENDVENSQYFNYENRKTFWKKIFLKVGFSPEQFEKSHFLPGIPQRFDNLQN